MPGPKGLPLLASMIDLRRDTLGTFERARREHGDVVRLVAGPPGLRSVFYAVFSPAGAQQVLATGSTVFRKDHPFYEEVRQSLGNGLLTSQDADYLRQRRLVQPLFTKRRVDGYAGTVAEEAAAVADRWRAALAPSTPAEAPAGGTAGAWATVDLVTEMNRLALRTVSRVLFGTDVEAAVEVVHRCLPVINTYVVRRGFSPLRPPRHWPTPGNRRAADATARMFEVCDRIIARRRRTNGVPAAAAQEGEDLLTLLARAGNEEDGRLDATEMREQVLIFLLAGHETTATSMAFTLHLLSRHPQEQRRAREEVDRVLGGRAPTADDLGRLPYLTRVLKEAMRLYPAAPVISRRSVEAARIGGFRVPAGADVIVSPWVTQRNPELWPEPERFDPERFTAEQEAARHRYTWFPFGGGPRACIGQYFSMLESLSAIAVLLRAYEFEAVDAHVPVAAGITLQAKGPARVRLRQRT
ncbi:cytochrome P450 [Streptomyces sp. MST-110588]|uniref:cytochrome P450 n=1 Tax=Streptomyces sp. MST-110588 TaxID=2833628 RepID=UPI00241426D4|nr:cytochrome P450 [Streptomyces sp. MST-110588]